jgi:hypothetical protein
MSIDVDANQDLALNDEDAGSVTGGKRISKGRGGLLRLETPVPAAQPVPQVAAAVQGSDGDQSGPIVDDPSEEC